MNISFENPDKINGLMTITIEKEDYQADVEKTLKDYRKRANVPGFRPGKVPMGMIVRQYGEGVKAETINKLLGEELYKYVRENKIMMLGDPLPNEEKQQKLDFKTDGPFEFVFDIAVAPEFKAELTASDSLDYYKIDVDEKLVNDQVEAYRTQTGHRDKAENYDPEQNDMLKGDLRELDADGNPKEGGVVVADAVLMPEYIKVDDQKKLFDGSKLGDIITFNPRKAYPEGNAEIKSLLKLDSDEAAQAMTSDFTYQITEVSRFVKGELNQELFDQVFGKDTVKDEASFRAKVKESIENQLVNDSDYKLLLDVREYLEKKVGELQFPDALLKKIMLLNNKDKDQKFVDDNYEQSIKELKWHLIKEQLVAATQIKVEDKDVKEVAKQAIRIQFAQYGMSNVPEEYVEQYADEQLKQKNAVDRFVDRAIDVKLTEAIKKVVKLNEKSISLEDFNKMLQGN